MDWGFDVGSFLIDGGCIVCSDNDERHEVLEFLVREYGFRLGFDEKDWPYLNVIFYADDVECIHLQRSVENQQDAIYGDEILDMQYKYKCETDFVAEPLSVLYSFV